MGGADSGAVLLLGGGGVIGLGSGQGEGAMCGGRGRGQGALCKGVCLVEAAADDTGRLHKILTEIRDGVVVCGVEIDCLAEGCLGLAGEAEGGEGIGMTGAFSLDAAQPEISRGGSLRSICGGLAKG